MSKLVTLPVSYREFTLGTQVQIGDNPQPVGTVVGPAPGGGVYINITGPMIAGTEAKEIHMESKAKAEDAAKPRNWRDAYPVGSACEVDGDQWRSGLGWQQARVLRHDTVRGGDSRVGRPRLWLQCDAYKTGVTDGNMQVTDAEHVRPLSPAKPAEAKREPRMPRPGDVWAGPYGVRCRLSLGPDGALMEERIAPNPCPPKRCYRDGRHFIESPAWTLITPAPELGEVLPKPGELWEMEGMRNDAWRVDRVEGGVVYAALHPSGGVVALRGVKLVRRLSPSPAPGQGESISGGASVPGKTAELQRASAQFKAGPALCPSCSACTLRRGAHEDTRHLLRCSGCSWAGTDAQLAEARKPDDTEYTAALDCPACRAPHHTARRTANGVYACPCGWSGGETLAAAKREACKPKMRFKVGDRVRLLDRTMLDTALCVMSVPCQVMECCDDGTYLVTETLHLPPYEEQNQDDAMSEDQIRERARALWPKESP